MSSFQMWGWVESSLLQTCLFNLFIKNQICPTNIRWNSVQIQCINIIESHKYQATNNTHRSILFNLEYHIQYNKIARVTFLLRFCILNSFFTAYVYGCYFFFAGSWNSEKVETQMSQNSTFRIMSESSHNVVLVHLVTREPTELEAVNFVVNVGNMFSEENI